MREVFIIIFIVGMFSFGGCKQNSSSLKTGVQESKTIKESIHIDICTKCDSIYNAFPRDSTVFEELYGYPHGIRQGYGYEDFQNYFLCLEKCYDSQKLLIAINLGMDIKYDADGPSYLQYHMTEYLMKNDKRAIEVYSNMSCGDYKKHINFLFEGIPEFDSFLPKLCSFLKELKLEEDCKQKILDCRDLEK